MAERRRPTPEETSRSILALKIHAANLSDAKGVDFGKVLENGDNLQIRLDYLNNESRRSIPDPLLRFAKRVYGREVLIRNITLWWVNQIKGEVAEENLYSNVIEILVRPPGSTSGLENQHMAIVDQKNELLTDNLLWLRLEENRASWSVNYNLAKEIYSTEDHVLTPQRKEGNLVPRIIDSLSAILSSVKEDRLGKFSPQDLLRPSRHLGIQTAAVFLDKYLPQLPSPVKQPVWGVFVIDRDSNLLTI